MIRLRLLLGLFAAAAASPLLGGAASQRFDWRPVDGLQDVNVESDRVAVTRIEFDLGSTLKGTPIRKSSAKAIVRVDNNGFLDQQVGVAVVVFDSEGNVVAAGSAGTKWGYLNKGERSHYTITFPYLYRRLEDAVSFQVTLETLAKGEAGREEAAEKKPSDQIESQPIR